MRIQNYQIFLVLVFILASSSSAYRCRHRGWRESLPHLMANNDFALKNIFSASLIAFSLTNIPMSCEAIDPSQLKQFQASGDLADQLKRLQEVQNTLDAADLPFIDLKSGVSYRQFRDGKGDMTVQPGYKVTVELVARCKSFTTANEPGGVRYYSTKVDTKNNELSWVIGDGSLLPGLEEAMIGMKKSAVRRVDVPSVQVFRARKDSQLPLPSKSDDDGNRRFKNLFKTDAGLLIEVLVKQIEPPESLE